jgi:hypothetical protein
MRDRIKVRGKVTVRVLDKDGNVKRKAPGRFRRLLGIPGRLMEFYHHNIVTGQGDQLIADALTAAPARTKVTSGSGFIQVGTGWTGNSTKYNTRCNTATGPMKALDSGYAVIKGQWGQYEGNVVVYQATFALGELTANNINEACLLNGNDVSANCLAYAQITPSVNITANDTLQIQWEITILGQ